MNLCVQAQEAADKLQCNIACKQELTGQLLLMYCLLLLESTAVAKGILGRREEWNWLLVL